MKTLEEKYPNFYIPLDEEEVDIMKAIENDELHPDEHSEKNMKMLKEVAKNTPIKKPVSLRIQTSVLDFYKNKSIEDWIPYQTLMNSVIHKYANGTLKRAD